MGCAKLVSTQRRLTAKQVVFLEYIMLRWHWCYCYTNKINNWSFQQAPGQISIASVNSCNLLLLGHEICMLGSGRIQQCGSWCLLPAMAALLSCLKLPACIYGVKHRGVTKSGVPASWPYHYRGIINFLLGDVLFYLFGEDNLDLEQICCCCCFKYKI